MTMRTPMGRKLRTKMRSHGGPLVRIKPADLDAAHVERVGRVASIKDGQPVLEDGRVLNVSNVIWCTGFHSGFSWIDLPVFDEQGWPEQERGIVQKLPGLYFLGQMFIYAASSTMIHGVSRDAKYIARSIATRARARTHQAPARKRVAATGEKDRSAVAAMFVSRVDILEAGRTAGLA